MGENSKIEWTDHTFNPWIGCQKVSAGCDHCYAETQNAFRKWNGGTWGPHAPRKRTSDANWNQPIKWNEAAKRDGVRRRVFCASLADWLDNQAPDEWRVDLAMVIDATPHLDWLLLTKRIENFWERAPWPTGEVPGNVWLGVTTEDQPNYNRRWTELAQIPCAFRFISYEPALGPLHLLPPPTGLADFPDWVICGGESGTGARPMDSAWARSVRDQCRTLRVPFFFKQWGEWAHEGQCDSSGRRIIWPTDCESTNRVGKKRAGRLLDGVEHNGFPA